MSTTLYVALGNGSVLPKYVNLCWIVLAKTLVFILSFWMWVVAVDRAYAAGFSLPTYSANSAGTSHASGPAAANESASQHVNPAALSRLTGTRYSVGSDLYLTRLEYTDKGSTLLDGVTAISGDPSSDGGTPALLPNLFYSRQLNERWSIGFGVSTPFGLSTKYDEDWVGRYQAIDTEFATIDLNPAIGYRINKHLSLGAGISVQYAETTLTNSIDFGSIGAQEGLIPQAADGFFKVTGSDWSTGFNLGLLYEFDKNSRVGLSYRSNITQQFDLKATFTLPPSVVVPNMGVFSNTDANFKVELPEIGTVGLFHQMNDDWSVMFSLSWTNWSRNNESVIVFDNPNQPTAVIPQQWRDTYRTAIGTEYRHNDQWTIRCGLAYDQDPAPNAFRNPRIPTSNLTWIALGFTYKLSNELKIDVAHQLVLGEKVSYQLKDLVNGQPTFAGNLNGKKDITLNVLSIELRWLFDS